METPLLLLATTLRHGWQTGVPEARPILSPKVVFWELRAEGREKDRGRGDRHIQW